MMNRERLLLAIKLLHEVGASAHGETEDRWLDEAENTIQRIIRHNYPAPLHADKLVWAQPHEADIIEQLRNIQEGMAVQSKILAELSESAPKVDIGDIKWFYTQVQEGTITRYYKRLVHSNSWFAPIVITREEYLENT